MALSLGLMISLGFTTLLCVLLFFYIRQRTSSIDTKITKLFKVIQDEVSKNNSSAYITSQRPQPQPQPQNMIVTEIENKNTIQPQEEKNEEPEYSDSASTNDSNDEDGDSSSDDSDSEIGSDDEDDLISVSTGISETDGEILNDDNDDKNDFVEHQNVNDNETDTNAIKVIQQKQDIENVLKSGNLETITDLNLYTNILKNKDELDAGELSNISDLESLELADDNDDDDDGEDGNTYNKQYNDVEGDDGDDDGNDDDGNDDDEKQTTIDSIINYKKLSVTKLREIVKKNNLHENPQKLKKNELVKLLES